MRHFFLLLAGLALAAPLAAQRSSQPGLVVGYPSSLYRSTLSRTSVPYNIMDYGAKCDGVTDDAAAIQATLNVASGNPGGYVTAPAAVCALGSTVTIAGNGVQLVGQGANYNADVGTLTGGTIFRWIGASGGTMFKAAPVTGASAQALKGIRIENLSLDCNGVAGIALQLLSVQGSVVGQMYYKNCSVANVDLNVVSQLGENRGTTRNLFYRWMVRNTVTAPIGIRIDGDEVTCTSANTSNNDFEQINVLYGDSTALRILNGDSNRFWGLNFSRISGKGGTGIELMGSATASDACVARNNSFFFLDPGAGGVTGHTGTSKASRDNRIYDYSTENGAPQPTVDSLAGLSWTSSHGYDNSYARQSGDRGDNSVTLVAGADAPVQIFNTALGSNRTCTVNTTGVNGSTIANGAHFLIVRTAAATGASTLTCFGKALTAGQYVLGAFNGTAWVEIQFGSL